MARINMFTENVSADKACDDAFDCEELVTRRLDSILKKEQEQIDKEMEKHLSKMIPLLSIWFVIELIGVLVGFVLLFFAVSQFSENASVALSAGLIGVIALAIAGIVWLWQKKGKKPHEESDEYKAFSDKRERFYQRCERSLHVPEDAPEIDVFTYLYSEEKGIRKSICENDGYVNEIMRVFAEDGKLCLFYVDCVWGIPLDAIEELREIDEEIYFAAWNKDIPHDGGDYLQYQITYREEEDDYRMRGYHALRFTYESRDYELLVASYDIEMIRSLLSK